MSQTQTSANVFELPALPWAPDALAPVISPRTLEFHHGQPTEACSTTPPRSGTTPSSGTA